MRVVKKHLNQNIVTHAHLIEIEFDRQLGRSETCLRRLIINDDGMGIHENCFLNFFCSETLPQEFLFVEEKSSLNNQT